MTLWEEIKESQASLIWEGTFAEYYEMVKARPAIARLAHARIYNAIQHFGAEVGQSGEQSYKLFSAELFGLEQTIRKLNQYFASAARGLETRKRILLLIGPPGSGKTTLANLLKRGVERYSRTPEGALYAISGCPIQEEPLHLIPADFRRQAETELGIKIEGELCPYCRWLSIESYQGDVARVPVRRVVLNEAAGVGIGTFIATDPRSQDITRLIGSLNYDLIGEDRLQPSGPAYRLDGELNVANRGLVEFVEIFKLEERFLAMLLILTEEQRIKAPGFGTLYVDEAILAHSNEAEYLRMIADQRSEALQDRIVVLQVPYNLRVREEARIYQKLLRSVDLGGVHLSPLSLPVAATLAVLSRLEPSKKWGVTLPIKLRLYDDQYVRGYTQQDAEELREEFPREGMSGISPRFIINQISHALSQTEGCLDPLDLLRFLWEGIEQSTSLPKVEKERLFSLFRETRQEYDRLALKTVQMAMVDNFHGKAEALWQGYLANVKAYVTGSPAADPSSGEELSVDIQAMRQLERRVELDGRQAEHFRQALLYEKLKSWRAQGIEPDYTFEPRISAAIEGHLLPDRREVARVVAPFDKLDMERRKQQIDLVDRLKQEHGFDQDCAEALIAYTARFLGMSKVQAVWPKSLKWLTD